MTDKDNSFLSNLINEDIYVISNTESISIEKDSTTPSLETVEEVAPEATAEVVKEVSQAETPVAKEPTIESQAPIKAEEPKEIYITPLPTEGQNLKHCLVFIESEETILESAPKTFLENILKAVKRSLDDVLLVNIKEANKEQIEALLVEQNHRHVLCFGSDKLNHLIESEAYMVSNANHKFYLKADDLNLISSEKDKKKALWTALQEMFL